jgi:octaprenyl-diphosphate synthase
MAEGEVLQLINTCDIDLSEEQYIEVVRNKTAVLIAAACQCGGILGQATCEQQNALHELGMELGIAFQFMDDALDYVAEESEFGKARGHDLAEGKMTLPLIEALRHCSGDERQRVADIVSEEELSDADLGFVMTLIETYHGISYTMDRARELVEHAKTKLELFPDNQAKVALCELADYVVSRRK